MITLKKICETLTINQVKSKSKVAPEMIEIGDITEMLIDRLENKMKALKALEARADQKIAMLDGLITKCKNLNLTGDFTGATPESHRSGVQALAGKGFKPEQIARILDVPSGEVELILNLVH
jgi:hypothetical protein